VYLPREAYRQGKRTTRSPRLSLHAGNVGGKAPVRLYNNNYVIGDLGEGYNFSRSGFISWVAFISLIMVYIQENFSGQFTQAN